ncbi:hypothetical protein [Halalkalibacter oceani]|uniref:hypothetical protein n=1 Tax=Halalkalibacter oceani TaxID=1653776 RepID=UPI003395D74D
MKKFKCVIKKRYEYEIELDENQMNKEWMEGWKNVFYDFDSLEEHAEHIAQVRANKGTGFIEGYGNVLENGKRPLFLRENEKINESVNINVIEDNELSYINVEEV